MLQLKKWFGSTSHSSLKLVSQPLTDKTSPFKRNFEITDAMLLFQTSISNLHWLFQISMNKSESTNQHNLRKRYFAWDWTYLNVNIYSRIANFLRCGCKILSNYRRRVWNFVCKWRALKCLNIVNPFTMFTPTCKTQIYMYIYLTKAHLS